MLMILMFFLYVGQLNKFFLFDIVLYISLLSSSFICLKGQCHEMCDLLLVKKNSTLSPF